MTAITASKPNTKTKQSARLDLNSDVDKECFERRFESHVQFSVIVSANLQQCYDSYVDFLTGDVIPAP